VPGSWVGGEFVGCVVGDVLGEVLGDVLGSGSIVGSGLTLGVALGSVVGVGEGTSWAVAGAPVSSQAGPSEHADAKSTAAVRRPGRIRTYPASQSEANRR